MGIHSETMNRVLFLALPLLGVMMLSASGAELADARLVVAGTDHAIVIMDGERLVLDRGERKGEVLLVRADNSEAVLRPGEGAAPVLEEAPAEGPESGTLWAWRR